MLDYLQAVSLLALIVTHAFLVRGCFSIKQELPLQGGILAGRLDRTADLLDEVAQLIADLADGQAGAGSPAVPESPIGLLLNSLLNRSTMQGKHGDPQEQIWTVLPSNDDPTTEEDNEPHGGGATIPNR